MIPITLDNGYVYWSPEPLADAARAVRLVAVDDDVKLPCGDRASHFFGWCAMGGQCEFSDECPVS